MNGEPISTTSSSAPMSMPSSSELVATIADSSPRFSRCSTTRRISRESEPWCAQATVAPASSLMNRAIFSACRRELTKNSVDRLRAMIAAAVAGQAAPQLVVRSVPGGAGRRCRRPARRRSAWARPRAETAR